MFCPDCSAKIEVDQKFCPQCGLKLPPSLQQDIPLPSHTPSQMVQKKAMPIWFKLLALIAVLALIGVTAGILFTESWVDVVDHQLEYLREQNIEKAYASYTSKDFQMTTSLHQFRHFIEAYPVFENNQSAHFTQRSIEHNIGTLRGNLTSSDHVDTPIEYKLIKEEGKWKILSIRLLKPGKIQNAKEASQIEDLIEVAKGQLKEIQEQKLSEAYQNYSSKEFKETTSEQAFLDFLNRYPILVHYHMISFHKPTIRNGIGTLSVILQSEQVAAYVKYYFIYEDQKWKIWSLRILSPSEKQETDQGTSSKEDANQDSIHLETITIGDQLDEEGQIKDPKKVFPSNLEDLYADIKIKNGMKGSMIYLNLQHLGTGSSIPAKAAIEENGDTMLMSVFSPPPNGWLKGGYTLTITTSFGADKTIDFIIE